MAHTLILGGIRSGKSAQAEQVARQSGGAVVYVATATAGDREMAERIRQHRQRRPARWSLVEEPLALGRVLRDHRAQYPCLLIDCMSLWLSNLLHAGDETMARERADFQHALDDYPGPVVIVSNEVGLGTIGMDPLTRRFTDQLGWLNQALAAHCQQVILVAAGLPLVLK
ncbi:bifunctional adenosylcobinamide kinase/adenosylcobinamide-phosphate guanylyltransferase [Alcanivorax sp. N3-2A]|nr:bifunctional adenosylcobinamide kinase/adenosylcobinamide-phosphate guanylyltransferase [Alcanivorax sp. N3-2A]|tara:strand:- start:11451 stop:11960 length:510 start_codon:yes stop_codon:yes gene_type:complete